MATAVQVQYRRGTSSQVASFTGAAGEMVVDTTNNRVVVHDGATAGGFAAAKLSEVQTNSRTQVNDAAYTALTTDRLIAYIALTAARTVSLPAASAFPSGSRLLVVDESGACSATNTIALSRAGADLIDGAATAAITAAYGYLALESNGSNKWTIVDQAASVNGLTGAVSIASSGGNTVTALGSTITIGEPGGMLNKFRNGTMDVWQRGTSSLTVTTAGAYVADGWIVLPAGASVTAAQGGGRLLSKNSLLVTGATSVTDVIVKQRIESLIAAAFCSQTVTVQAQVYNNTGGAITPTLTVKHAGSQDVWTSPTTDVNAVNLQSCANGAWTLVAYTFAANAASYNGLEISFDFGNNFGGGTKTLQITECDIRVTPGVVTGLNSNPPPPELRPVASELAFCTRYLWVVNRSGGQSIVAFGAAYSTSAAFFTYALPAPMRSAPTLTLSSASDWSMIYGALSTTIVTSMSSITIGAGENVAQINLAGTGTPFTAGQAAGWFANNANARAYFSAEL
jgi:Major tropism determinant N-terminal domain